MAGKRTAIRKARDMRGNAIVIEDDDLGFVALQRSDLKRPGCPWSEADVVWSSGITRKPNVTRQRRSGGPWIQDVGSLGGKGFLSKPRKEQERLIDNAVEEDGYRSTLGKIEVLNRNRKVRARWGEEIDELKDYLVEEHGGEGSFGYEDEGPHSSRAMADERWEKRRKGNPPKDLEKGAKACLEGLKSSADASEEEILAAIAAQTKLDRPEAVKAVRSVKEAPPKPELTDAEQQEKWEKSAERDIKRFLAYASELSPDSCESLKKQLIKKHEKVNKIKEIADDLFAGCSVKPGASPKKAAPKKAAPKKAPTKKAAPKEAAPKKDATKKALAKKVVKGDRRLEITELIEFLDHKNNALVERKSPFSRGDEVVRPRSKDRGLIVHFIKTDSGKERAFVHWKPEWTLTWPSDMPFPEGPVLAYESFVDLDRLTSPKEAAPKKKAPPKKAAPKKAAPKKAAPKKAAPKKAPTKKAPPKETAPKPSSGSKSYEQIKKDLSAAKSALKGGDLAKADKIIREAVAGGATRADLSANLTKGERSKLRSWDRKVKTTRSLKREQADVLPPELTQGIAQAPPSPPPKPKAKPKAKSKAKTPAPKKVDTKKWDTASVPLLIDEATRDGGAMVKLESIWAQFEAGGYPVQEILTDKYSAATGAQAQKLVTEFRAGNYKWPRTSNGARRR